MALVRTTWRLLPSVCVLLGSAQAACTFDLAPLETGPVDAGGDGGNLVGNPSFESGLDNWHGSNAVLTRAEVGDAPDGCCVARLTREVGDDSDYYGIDDDTPVVAAAEPGATYRARAWARRIGQDGGDGGAEREARIFLRQGATLEQIGASPDVILGDSFVQVEVTATALCSGGPVDVHLSQSDPADGDAFEVDGVEVVRVSAATEGACP